ncbi:MAG TPA: pantoate--beta-alanine ligase [Solirubrobacteraceae bacterium]|nr:pantoate--beta-alanine ligase [Solirubrobacteraceae bacterium]
MITLRTVSELRDALAAPRRAGARIGLVPTMGALHAGHLSLIRRARASCDVVVVSLFVNPAQFTEAADLGAYPRDEAQDAHAADGAGADILFAPAAQEVYPPGFATQVSVTGITEPLEGAHRGVAHFDGVATVVTKLLNMVGPEVAFFGEKDAQQALVVRRLVSDLNIPTEIATCPTVREADGLAMSSRNVHLGAADRRRAVALHRALSAAAERVAGGERSAEAVLEAAHAQLRALAVEPEYLALADPHDLSPVTDITGPALLLVAARVGDTRLIDNRLLEPVPAPC